MKEDRRRRLARESTRAWLAIAVAFVPMTLLTAGYVAWRGDDQSRLLTYALSLVLYLVAYLWLTYRVFSGVEAAQLRTLVTGRESRLRTLLAGGREGPGFSVQFAAIALGFSVFLPRTESLTEFRFDQVALAGLIVAVVALSWLLAATGYAVHYARRYFEAGGLDFPGRTEPGFADFFYLSATVATTFGTTDVTVTSPRMRRVMTGHLLLAFVFNSVIVALLVAALVT